MQNIIQLYVFRFLLINILYGNKHFQYMYMIIARTLCQVPLAWLQISMWELNSTSYSFVLWTILLVIDVCPVGHKLVYANPYLTFIWEFHFYYNVYFAVYSLYEQTIELTSSKFQVYHCYCTYCKVVWTLVKHTNPDALAELVKIMCI